MEEKLKRLGLNDYNRKDLLEMIGVLSNIREIGILNEYLEDGVTYESLACLKGVSVPRIGQQVRKGARRIGRRFELGVIITEWDKINITDEERRALARRGITSIQLLCNTCVTCLLSIPNIKLETVDRIKKSLPEGMSLSNEIPISVLGLSMSVESKLKVFDVTTVAKCVELIEDSTTADIAYFYVFYFTTLKALIKYGCKMSKEAIERVPLSQIVIGHSSDSTIGDLAKSVHPKRDFKLSDKEYDLLCKEVNAVRPNTFVTVSPGSKIDQFYNQEIIRTTVEKRVKFNDLYNDIDGQINSNRSVIRISKQALSVLDPDKVSVDNIWKHMLYLSAYTPCRLDKMYVYKDEVLALKPSTPYSGAEVIDAVIKLARDNPRTEYCYSSRQDTPFPVCAGR